MALNGAILTIPIGGGLGVLLTSEKVLIASLKARQIANIAAMSMRVRVVTTLAPLAANPAVQQSITGFSEGFFVPGPVSSVPGVIGFGLSEVIGNIGE